MWFFCFVLFDIFTKLFTLIHPAMLRADKFKQITRIDDKDPKKVAAKKAADEAFAAQIRKNGKIMVEKKDGSIGEWGNPMDAPSIPVPKRDTRTNAQIIQEKEMRLRKASQYDNGGGRRQ